MLLSASSALAEDQEVWIASGLPGGTYRSVYATNLEKLMRGYKFYYHSSSGSRENLTLLLEGKADLAFAQADVYAGALRLLPEEAKKLVILGRLADECVYVAYRVGGRITSFAQLEAPPEGRPVKVAVGLQDGGAAGTWRHLGNLKPGLQKAEVAYEGDTLALNRLAVGNFDAVVWVTDPTNHDHKMLRGALANDTIDLMPIDDPALVVPLEDGTRSYDSKTVKLTGSWRAPKLDTICTSAMVFSREGADEAMQKKVADRISLDLGRIVRSK